jgi:SAM-dependent methyltransferase
MKRAIARLLPPTLRRPLRQTLHRLSRGTYQVLRKTGLRDVGERFEEWLGWGDPLASPRGMPAAGDGDARIIGERFVRYFIDLAGLQPTHHVLDIGCGIGRIAAPLTRLLSPEGGYEGIDIVPATIDRCRRTITARFPHFRFRWADVANQAYNPLGKQPASAFHFPYPDGAFDLVLLTSVFTHMLPQELDHYLKEIARLLRPGGRCLITAFLLNAESRRFIQAGKSLFTFAHEHGHCAVEQPDLPEAAIAYEETHLRRQYEQAGLRLIEPIHYGSWCGRARFLDGQDLIIAAKP